MTTGKVNSEVLAGRSVPVTKSKGLLVKGPNVKGDPVVWIRSLTHVNYSLACPNPYLPDQKSFLD